MRKNIIYAIAVLLFIIGLFALTHVDFSDDGIDIAPVTKPLAVQSAVLVDTDKTVDPARLLAASHRLITKVSHSRNEIENGTLDSTYRTVESWNSAGLKQTSLLYGMSLFGRIPDYYHNAFIDFLLAEEFTAGNRREASISIILFLTTHRENILFYEFMQQDESKTFSKCVIDLAYRYILKDVKSDTPPYDTLIHAVLQRLQTKDDQRLMQGYYFGHDTVPARFLRDQGLVDDDDLLTRLDHLEFAYHQNGMKGGDRRHLGQAKSARPEDIEKVGAYVIRNRYPLYDVYYDALYHGRAGAKTALNLFGHYLIAATDKTDLSNLYFKLHAEFLQSSFHKTQTAKVLAQINTYLNTAEKGC